MAIDINNATAEELAGVKGVTPQIAATIIEYRDENGGFSSIDEVGEVPGCDDNTVQALEEAGVEAGASIDDMGY